MLILRLPPAAAEPGCHCCSCLLARQVGASSTLELGSQGSRQAEEEKTRKVTVVEANKWADCDSDYLTTLQYNSISIRLPNS